MKKKNTYKSVSTKTKAEFKPKSIPKSIGSKLLMLLGLIIPVAALIGYSMNVNFFSIARILSLFVLIISIAAFLKDEIIYPNIKAVQHDNSLINKKKLGYNEKRRNFSSLIKKGTFQVILSILTIIACTYLGQAIYKILV
ncbi:hypothetical protein K9O30_05810 [Clostridium bowmanii]|uniref:hypothetical protein n=1 Tax=Clostridium bowmanii TaxID=132925 RepID=UPI001C0BAAE4|nr:hypothetical protein [Clostridium bowmanii]MBU3188675.1 hypothetical protein [Clostridium bowmanii]MCA1073260.1 hypothetical protein [Clostridium bowmanii]